VGACFGQVDAVARTGRDHFPDRDRLRLPLGLNRLSLAVLDHVVRRPIGGLSDEDAVDRRGRLEAGGRVDDIPGRHALPFRSPRAERDQRLAGVHRQSELELILLLADPVKDRERRANGSLRIVLVSGRRAEERHHGVADELLDGAAEALELFAQPGMERGEQPAHVFRIELLGASSETDQIGEQHGHDLALLARLGEGSLEGCAAGTAKTGASRILLRTTRADDHAQSLRPRTASF
jgi:hypothetical protein